MHRTLTTLACALTAVLAAAWSPAPPARPAVATTVHTRDGLVRGAAHDGYRTFEGIPYAAPPVGTLRWAAPRRPAAWTGVRDATRPASACPQPAGEVPGGSTDEDCLHLNVTTPDGASPAHPRPVIVWLHGGGFTTGAGSSYDAHRMAVRGDVVVVTVNYRLGALGFLARAGLPGSGTFGLADQQAALRWVRAGIGAFGGDPHEVTLAGESAGGYSVCAQLASPAAAGLFDRAIIESGPCTGSPDRPFAPSAVPLSTARDAGADLASNVGCGSSHDVLACLRRVRVSRLLAAQDTDQQPAYGTPLLPGDPTAAIAGGRFHQVPVLIGNNHDEGNGWAAGIIQAGHPVTPATWPDVAAAFFPSPGQAEAVVRAYPVHGADGGPVFGAVIGDADFACPTARTGGLLAARVPVWRYEFADEHAPPLTPGTPPFPLGAPHASELPYLFDLGGRPRELTAAQHRLADTMIDYWSRFARTADPNGPSAPVWSRHTVLSLAPDHVVPTRTAESRHHCAFWSALEPGGWSSAGGERATRGRSAGEAPQGR
ncbi:carboxylesterase/lipase family protein [Streptomyces sp. Ag109_O5-10]|uniref:carboxylesterase/lipase family protein n=1 Tax=Streptomyces sp. Ag109_O5-10 TaxID=1855349 RepID=UPI0008975E7A|nr:carboxylesterase family protein [Streptomyces sp. Ag109_O5-10]SEF16820.1 para-nitrobenzyl esterase [Streptomyces sp. Ag109_O5-10]